MGSKDWLGAWFSHPNIPQGGLVNSTSLFLPSVLTWTWVSFNGTVHDGGLIHIDPSQLIPFKEGCCRPPSPPAHPISRSSPSASSTRTSFRLGWCQLLRVWQCLDFHGIGLGGLNSGMPFLCPLHIARWIGPIPHLTDLVSPVDCLPQGCKR